LPVINADFTIGIAATGTVMSAGGGFVSRLSTTIGALTWPKISAVGAVQWAAKELGLSLTSDPTLVDPLMGPTVKPATWAVVDAKTVSLDPIPAKLVYAPTGPGAAALAWELVIRTPDGQHHYDMTVDASTGGVLSQADWIDNDTYNVVAQPNENPQDG